MNLFAHIVLSILRDPAGIGIVALIATLFIFAVQAMLFHQHTDGGLYFKRGDVNLKDPSTGNWVEGVAYRAAAAPYFGDNVTTRVRWEDRFTPVYLRTSQEAYEDAHWWFMLALITFCIVFVGGCMVVTFPDNIAWGRSIALLSISAVGCVWSWRRFCTTAKTYDIAFHRPR